MGLKAAVRAALAAVGEPFGAPPIDDLGGAPEAAAEPRWGALYLAVGEAADEDFATAIELVYEGYLLHYRESRVLSLPGGDVATRLLAGDCYYARGLRGIAARGDIDAVGLLTRLMATCSYLRVAGAPFAADDALWAYTTAALAAQHAGASPAPAVALFDEVDRGLAGDAALQVDAIVRAAACDLALRDTAALFAELDAAAGAALVPSVETSREA